MCFVIENVGTQPAFDISITLNESFIENIEDIKIKQAVTKLKSSNLFLASKQKVFLFIGSQTEFKAISANKAIFEISYCGQYQDHIEIDLNEYGFMLIYKSPFEDISYHLKKIQEEQNRFENGFLEQVKRHSQYPQTVIVHSATDEDSLKFKIYKTVCVKHRATLKEIADACNLDMEIVHKLLVELYYVDNLVVTYINQNPADFNENTVWLIK